MTRYATVVSTKYSHRSGRSAPYQLPLRASTTRHGQLSLDCYFFVDSDHRVISFNILACRSTPNNQNIGRYNVKKANWDLFQTTLLGEVGRITNDDINSIAEGIDRVLTIAADAAIPKLKTLKTAGKNVWWSPHLTALRKNLIRRRRQGLRSSDRPLYNQLRNEFLTAIRKQKLLAWKILRVNLTPTLGRWTRKT